MSINIYRSGSYILHVCKRVTSFRHRDNDIEQKCIRTLKLDKDLGLTIIVLGLAHGKDHS